ncbi:hypothetical protein, partial [Acinetobacter pittii]|uniref:hypothetical protein n=1 Tax=Acinetobacter pittii TaxID=48296 RepID=UPI00202A8725
MTDKKQNDHLNLDGINSSYNDGDGLRINNPEDFRSITISNGYFSNNKGNGITIGSPQQSPLEIILTQLAPKLPDTIQPYELASVIQNLLESTNQEGVVSGNGKYSTLRFFNCAQWPKFST